MPITSTIQQGTLSLAAVTPGNSAIGDAAAAGTSASVARADHVHGREAAGTAGASAVGDTAAAGSATTVARSDHRHSREAFGTPVNIDASLTSLSAGSLTTVARADHVHTVSKVPVLIASTTLASAASSYTFTNIPQTYTHLKLYASYKSTYTGTLDYGGIYLNTDGTSTMKYANAYSTNGLNNYWDTCPTHGTGNKVAYHCWMYMDIGNYTSGQYKIMSARGTYNYTASGSASYSTIDWGGGQIWLDVTAISAMKLFLNNAFASGSQFWLYGIP